MNEHRSIIITSFTIFILLSCFIPQSEGQVLLPLDKTFGEPLCNEGYVNHQHPLIHPLYYNFQNKEANGYTGFCSGSIHFFSILKYLTSLRKDVFFQNGINTLIHHSVPLLFFMINYSLNLNR